MKRLVSKSRFDGFEFWGGRGWSSDKKLYKKLCEHDTEITTMSELNNKENILRLDEKKTNCSY